MIHKLIIPRMVLYRNKHAGNLVRNLLNSNNLTVNECAELIKYDPKILQKVVDCSEPVTADLAIRLEKLLGYNSRMLMKKQYEHELRCMSSIHIKSKLEITRK